MKITRKAEGKHVHIEWYDPQAEWHEFTVLRVVKAGGELWLALRGETQNGARHDGEMYWTRAAEIRAMERA